MSKLNALFLVGSLKQNSEDTNTLLLSQFLAKQLSTYDTNYEIVRLADYNIKPGTYTNVDLHNIQDDHRLNSMLSKYHCFYGIEL